MIAANVKRVPIPPKERAMMFVMSSNLNLQRYTGPEDWSLYFQVAGRKGWANLHIDLEPHKIDVSDRSEDEEHERPQH